MRHYCKFVGPRPVVRLRVKAFTVDHQHFGGCNSGTVDFEMHESLGPNCGEGKPAIRAALVRENESLLQKNSFSAKPPADNLGSASSTHREPSRAICRR